MNTRNEVAVLKGHRLSRLGIEPFQLTVIAISFCPERLNSNGLRALELLTLYLERFRIIRLEINLERL